MTLGKQTGFYWGQHAIAHTAVFRKGGMEGGRMGGMIGRNGDKGGMKKGGR